jgi:exonuclease III
LGAKKPFFEVFLEQASCVQVPLLIIGDLNTGRNDIDLEPGAAKFSCADQFIELTKSGGMIDLWRQSNGAEAREWTWRSSKNGFRIDHAFGNKALISSAAAINCSYDPSTRLNGITDHSGLIVEVIPSTAA